MEFDYKPEYTLTSEMLGCVSEIMELLGQISAVGDLSKQPILRRVNRIKTIQASAAIEGNTLTLEQVTAVVNGKTVLAPRNEILEIKNAFEAYKLLEEIDPFKIKDMLKVHGVMMKYLDDEAGKFRSNSVGIVDGLGQVIHVAPPPANVSPLIYKLYDWLKKEKVHELVKCSIFHHEFEFIHPFNDGNGRMGRFMQSCLLAKWKPIFAWIPVETIIKERQREYYKAFQDCRDNGGKSDHFIVYMLQAILDAVKRLQVDSQKFLKSQTTQIQKLMEVIDADPISAAELANKLNLKSTLGLRKTYLEPALELGLIAMTVPDKPTSKHQKYYKL